MPDKELLAHALNTWRKALDTLAEILAAEFSHAVRDAAIKRFEYNYELAWRTLRRFAQFEGETCDSPRQAFKTAFRLGWIPGEKPWLEMMNDRNLTVHTYHADLAQEVYERLFDHQRAFEEVYSVLASNLRKLGQDS
jgi:nucleotidyltransferase substrate binding protein (TIGR01987 family)